MKRRSLIAASTLAASGLVLAGCSASDGDTEVTLGVFSGWDESIASSLLWKAILEEKGYTVTLAEGAPTDVFTSLAAGDYDLVTDAWLPVTHVNFLEEFGNDIVELGAWFDGAALTVAVNADAPVDSLADLAANADVFDGTIVGIEPDSGLVSTVQTAVPVYGLEDMTLAASSTADMLAQLDSAMSSGQNIAVTLWEPHWAYGAYDLKNLDDPEGILGDAESIYTYANGDFPSEHPEVTLWLSHFTMSSELLYDLENQLGAATSPEEQEAIVASWIEANREWVDSLTASTDTTASAAQ